MDVKKRAWELKREGYSYAEIAKELGISKSTAYKYVKEFEKEDNVVENVVVDENIEKYVESGENNLKIASVDDVVEEINKKITIVEEPKTKVKKINEENDAEIEEKPRFSNKFVFLFVIAAVVIVAIIIYFVFFKKQNNESIGKEIEKQKEKVVEKRENPQNESTFERVSKYGISDKVVVL